LSNYSRKILAVGRKHMVSRESFFVKEIYGKVLDVGCVLGKFHAILAQKKGIELHGVDVVKADLSNFRVGNAENLPYKNGEFDCLVAGELIEHCKDKPKALREFNRVLKKGGILLISTPNKNAWLNKLFKAYEEKSQETDFPHCDLFVESTLRKMASQTGFEVEALLILPYN